MLALLNRFDSRYPTQQTRITLLSKLTLFAAIATYFLVVVGNIVRITDSGLGCPDWPFCYGNLLPGANTKAIIEMAHRYYAGLIGIIFCVIAFLNFRWQLHPRLIALSKLSGVVLAIQIILGALTVWSLLHEWSVALHLACGMAVLGCMVIMHLEVKYLGEVTHPDPARGVTHPEHRGVTHPQMRHNDASPDASPNKATNALRRSLVFTAIVLFFLLFTGGLMSGSGAAMACGVQFPLCNGNWLPNGSPLTFKHWLHRAVAGTELLLVLSTVHRIYKETKRGADLKALRKPALALVLGILMQAAIGIMLVLLQRPDPLATLHNAVGAFTWVSGLSLAVIALRAPIHVPDRAPKPVSARRQVINDYITLTKPRVISLLLFTTFAAMFITPAGAPPWYLVFWTMIGGYLMAGGANAVNMAYDIDIDNLMSRTKLRPTAGGRISSKKAYAFGFTLGALSLLIFVLFVNVLAAACAAVGFFYYTVIYTRWLKRSTWQNIVIGGGAGAVPPLIGYAAASGSLTLSAVLLFVIIFYWTPPHFWALALMQQKNYAAANIPMLPVVAGEAETTKQILLYTVLLVIFTLLLVPIQAMGGLYLVGALALGALFLWKSWQVNKDHSRPKVLSLYKYSLLYLALLFVVMMVDRLSALS